MSVLLLLEEQLFGATIDVGSHIIPRVVLIVLVCIRPCICQVDLTGFWPHVGKSVEDVSEFISRKILGMVVSSVNSLSGLSSV